MSDRTPMTEIERAILHKLKGASMQLYSGGKRFVRDLNEQSLLSSKGRMFLAILAQKYRRQYTLTPEELQYIEQWVGYQAPPEVKSTIVCRSRATREERQKIKDQQRLDEWEKLYGGSSA